jgi:hypothetical protein
MVIDVEIDITAGYGYIWKVDSCRISSWRGSMRRTKKTAVSEDYRTRVLRWRCPTNLTVSNRAQKGTKGLEG